jgi:alpha-L-rhamnosidase
MYYNLEPTPSFREWLVNVRAAQRGGAFPGIVPTDTWGYDWGCGMGWDNIIAELPYQMYRFAGNAEYVKENLDAIEKYLEFIKTKITDDGVIDYGLGEWVEVGRESAEGLTPKEVVNSLNFMDFMAKAAALFETAGRRESAECALGMRADMMKAFRRKYVKDGWVSCKTQTAQTLALAYGVFSSDEDALAYRNLRLLISGYNNRFKVGCFGLKYLFDVLSDHGDAAFAIELMTKPTYPSYGYWIEKFGATTLFEAFQEYEESSEHIRRKDGDDFIISLNHHFLGTVSAWFYRALAGLDVLSSDKIRIAPKFDSGLLWAEADFKNGDKRIFLRWEKVAQGYVITVENEGFELVVDIDGLEVREMTERKTVYFAPR